MPVFKIVDHYEVEDVDIRFQCPACEFDQTHRFRSHQDKIVTYCNRCEQTIHIEVVVCPSCNSSKYIARSPGSGFHDLVRCIRCNVIIKDGVVC